MIHQLRIISYVFNSQLRKLMYFICFRKEGEDSAAVMFTV